MLRDTLKMFQIAMVTVLVVCATFGRVFAHPSDGCQTYDYSRNDGRRSFKSAEWDFNDLTFGVDWENWSDLSPTEQYMIAGAEESSFGEPIKAWVTEVFVFLNFFYGRNGYIPDQLSEELVRSIPAYDQLGEERINLLRNPITNDWPRLDAQQFSPGDLYIRPLSEGELQHFASLDIDYYREWIEGVGDDPLDPSQEVPISVNGSVFYVKAYGEAGTVMSDFQYVCSYAY